MTVEPLGVRPADRILFLSIHDVAFVLAVAGQAPKGIVVGLGSDDEVRAARREARGLVNVMFAPATPDEIPWRAEFFTRVIDAHSSWEMPEAVAREIWRILLPGGTVHLNQPGPKVEGLKLLAFKTVGTGEGWLTLQK